VYGDSTTNPALLVRIDSVAPELGSPPAIDGTSLKLTPAGKISAVVAWSASDLSGIKRYTLQRSSDNGATWVNVFLPPVTDQSALVQRRLEFTSGTTSHFRVQATDVAGNVGPWSVGLPFTAQLRQESNAAICYVANATPNTCGTGSWTAASVTGASGGAVKFSGRFADAATFTFTGSGATFFTSVGPDRGQAVILVDNNYYATVDLYSATRKTRQPVIVSWGFDPTTTHTVKISVGNVKNDLSTSRRVDIDAFVWVRIPIAQ
jgi:hypothetical protein